MDCRVHAGAAADVLRRRRAVQLQPEGELRRAGVQRVRGPVGVRQLGRRAPDGGRLPRHRRQHPQRALHQPQAPLIRTPAVMLVVRPSAAAAHTTVVAPTMWLACELASCGN
jgi:hypothetical protein